MAMNTENSVLYSLIVVVMMAGLFSQIDLAGNIFWFFGQVESATCGGDLWRWTGEGWKDNDHMCLLNGGRLQ